MRESGGSGPARTLLLINEGLDSFHSVAVDGSALTGGAYYDWHALAPLLAGDGRRPADLRALSIGDAAGSLRAVYAGVHPGARVDGVEIDPACEALGREFFQPTKAAGSLYLLDGRIVADHAPATWHVVHVDAYAHQVYVPAHLASREFFAGVRERLVPGGIVACNVGALRFDDAVLAAVAATLRDVFGNATGFLVPNSRNCLLVARRDRELQPGLLANFTFGDEHLVAADAEAWRHIVTTAADGRRWRALGEGGRVLRDDRPELDELMMESYVASTDPGTAVACSGAQQPAQAELAAYEAARSGDWTGVLAAVAGASTQSAFLREIAGDARWQRRELEAAAAEYHLGIGLAGADPAKERIAEKLALLAEEQKPLAAALAASRRNGWLALAVGVVGAAVGLLLYRMSRMPVAPSVNVLVDAR
ncbi:MAG: fused MFS/spermidine synthase [Planctomycetota bacterium]